jgi:2-pyrone-4,6-dicarboxylate lactonase
MTERLPRNTCDTHLHVFGDAAAYPAAHRNALYAPPEDCTFAAVKALHDAMGVERAVFVQPTIYGTDHRLMYDVLKAASQRNYRGVAIVDDGVNDAELDRLNSVGVRGARFNFGGRFKLAPSHAEFRRGLDRVRELGWFVKVFGFDDDFLVVADELRKIDFPAIIDHMGGPDYRRGTGQPAVRLILDLLKNGNWWIGLSNGDLRSHTGYWYLLALPVIVSCGPTRTDTRTTVSTTRWRASRCWKDTCPIGRRATASWSTTRRASSGLFRARLPHAP